MSNIDKQDTREKFEAWAEQAGAFPWGHLKKQRNASGNYSVQVYTYMWHAWSACHDSLLDELEAKDRRNAELENILEAEIKSWMQRYDSSNNRREAAEKRVAQLEMFINQSCYVFDGRDVDISDAYIDAATSDLMPKIINSDEDESCRYCSDGSYSGLPGGACEHCMGTGLDNPAAGIKLQIEGE